jgi:cytosine/adenosine deaminase-related metal-dependent hydrolase
MRHVILLCLLLGACSATRAPGAAPSPPTLAVRGAILLPDGALLDDRVVLIAGERISAVGAARDVAIPAGTTVAGGPGTWVIPGLIDAHVHFFQSGGLYTRPDAFDLTARVPYAEERARIRDRLDETFARYLASGVTAVLDAGPMWNFEVRARAAASRLAPRVEVAGPLIASVPRPQLALDDPPILEILTPEAARAEVRRQAEHKPDARYLRADVTVAAEGRAAIETFFAGVFRDHPDVHCEITERKVEGDVVVFHERITGTERPVESAPVRYRVEGGLIRSVELPAR